MALQNRMNTKEQGSSRETPAIKPEWLRPKDVTAWFGLGRGRVYQLMEEGKVKNVSLRGPDEPHGTRLVSYASMAAYLESIAEGGVA